jgi:peptidoglycan hydrolase FlgJ
MALPAAILPPLPGDITSLRGRTDPAAVRAAAREMESMFAYEMIKAMRATAGGSQMGQGIGGDVYGSLFDMELAKVIAARGLGLQELVVRGLARSGAGQAAADSPASAGEATETAPANETINKHEQLQPVTNGGRFVLPVHEPPQVPSEVRPAVSGTHGADVAPNVSTPTAPEASFPIRRGGRVSSGFGVRKDPFTGRQKFHHGMDIAAPEGTPVFPAKGGRVTFSGTQPGYGNVVVVDHGDGFITKYAHNRANRVDAGDQVGPDTIIAEVGSTGRSTGPHLHFEVRYEGKQVRPEAVFAGAVKGNG